MPAEKEDSPDPSLGRYRYDQSAQDVQKRQVEKLMANPTKPAHVPDAPTLKQIRPPREMMRNVMGSSAGAGSGEFHIYKQARRREYERLAIMEEEEKQRTEQARIKARQPELEAINGATSTKNKAKRDKKKARRQKAKEDGPARMEESDSDAPADVPAAKKPKMAASGAALHFGQPPPPAGELAPAASDSASSRAGISVVVED